MLWFLDIMLFRKQDCSITNYKQNLIELTLTELNWTELNLTKQEISEVVDTSGLRCPEPVMMLHNVVRKVAAGEIIKVVATDPSTQRDIPKFCRYLGHELLEASEHDDIYVYLIRRA